MKLYDTSTGELLDALEYSAPSQGALVDNAKGSGGRLMAKLVKPAAPRSQKPVYSFEDALLRDLGQGLHAKEAPLRSSFHSACISGNTTACDWLEQRKGQGSDLVSASVFFPRRCDEGDTVSCLAAGWALTQLAESPGRPSNKAPNLKRGRQYIKKACKSGNSNGCVEWGRLNYYGIGAVRSQWLARRHFDAACSQGNARGCARAGVVRLRSKRDRAEGIALLREACSVDDAYACHKLGWLNIKGTGLSKNATLGGELLNKACTLGSMSACFDLAQVYSKGKALPRDRHRARRLYAQACSGGLEAACEELEPKWWAFWKWLW
jgi:uncharacterized protein